MIESKREFSYNTLPYGSRVFPHSGPDRLATVATLFGLDPARPDDCRALELGCGDGSNLIAMAYALPKSSFVGIDLSTVHIDQARGTAASLNLQNIEFIQADAASLSSNEIGHFDFISAHGLISWIPEVVREAVLSICADCLKENGVGYLSYNTYPGSYLRRIAWDMMRFHASKAEDPLDMVSRGREIVNFVAGVSGPDPYGTALREEARRLAERDDANVFHDDFSTENRPFYFHEFDSLLRKHRLQYLGEASLDAHFTQDIEPRAIELIEEFSGENRTTREQYLDFLVGRRFRASLFCRNDSKVSNRPIAGTLSRLYFTTHLVCAPGSDLTDANPVEFSNPEGSTITVANPATKQALCQMGDSYPKALPWVRICGDYTDADLASLSLDLISIYEMNLVTFCSFQPACADNISERPRASGLARLQISTNCRGATTLIGPNVEITQPVVRRLLVLLDGRRTQADIVEELLRLVPEEEQRSVELAERLRDMVSGNIALFLKLGLLEA
jgi:SAM-dependent methyltransferase